MVHHALRRFIESVFLAIPDGDSCMHLHGIVRLNRRDVDLVDLDGRCSEGTFGVAAMAQNTRAARLPFRRKGIVERGCHIELVYVVIKVNGFCRGASLVVGLRDNSSDKLSPVIYSLILKGGTAH